MSNNETNQEFPRAIIHIDGDAFFAGCEIASRPWLRGKLVVVGAERGIACAFSYEAKALGIHRGMSIFEIRKKYPETIILSSNYLHYSMYSNRMVQIVGRYSSKVEHYSVDECFADITGMNEVLEMSYEEIARNIKNDLDTELGTTFSLGLSVTKVLAKCGSKHKKPSGFTVVRKSEIQDFLKNVSIGKVWGIGTEGSKSLTRENIFTAYDLVSKSEEWVRTNHSKPIQEIHSELNGIQIFGLHRHETREDQKSIMCTRTFHPFSKDPSQVFSYLSKNIEEACARMRKLGLSSKNFSIFIKTKDFRYIGGEVKLIRETSYPEEILNEARKVFEKIFDKDLIYRTTGVRLGSLKPIVMQTESLFKENKNIGKGRMYDVVDDIAHKFGEHSVFLGSSMKAIVKYEKEKKKIGIPSLGEVR
ncbi:MAG: DNA polymerase IV [Patescibacteria group bacterium]